MPDILKDLLDHSLNSSKALHLQRRMLFKPYSSDEAHAVGLGHPFMYLADAAVSALIIPIFGAGLLLAGIATFNGELAKVGFLSIGFGILDAVLGILNAALSTIAFFTRTLSTIHRGYSAEAKEYDAQLELLCPKII